MSALLDQVRLARRLPTPPVAKAIREAAGVTQAAMAEELGVDRVTVARWEGGSRRPRGEFLAAYVALLEALHDEVRDA